MRVHLISPFLKDRTGFPQVYRFPNTGLALLAALTPEDINVSIIDEMYERVDFDAEVDLVGLSVTSNTAARAYEIADRFRERGVPIVLGGIHPTVRPVEAIQHADAVLIGEAEELWAEVLEDYKKERLRQFYRSNTFPNLKNLPIPRRELFNKNKYDLTNLVQTSRGCPFSCHFCSVSKIYGRRLRLRPLDAIISEIKALDDDRLFFVDDNIVGNQDHTEQLLTRLVPLKKKWISQAPVSVSNDKRLLKLLKESGCLGLLIGFETTSAKGLNEVNKKWNVNNDYFETIQRLHDCGISVVGSFILGFDSDDNSCFEKMLDFTVKSRMDAANFGVLTPFPGTILYERLRSEKRLIDDEWWLRYKGEDVVYRPKQMTRMELYEGWVWLMREFYRLRPTFERLLIGVGRRSLFTNVLTYRINLGYHRNAYYLPDNL